MSDSSPENQLTILCDMCTDEDRKPALMTCLKCEISMCAQHLQAHLTTPVLLKTHPLTEPMAPSFSGMGGTTRCVKHGKLLEYYCLDDLTVVCVACAIEDEHRLHNMKTLSTAHKELTAKLDTEQKALVNMEVEAVSLENWEKGDGEKVARSTVRLIEAVSSLRDVVLTSVQSSVSARAASVRAGKASAQAAQSEKDTSHFLEMYCRVHQDVGKAKAVDLRKGLEPGDEQDKLVQAIRQSGRAMLTRAKRFIDSLLILVDPENHREVFSMGKNLTFDPKTLGSGMTLSKDHRTVFYGSWLGPCPVRTLLIQGTQPSLGCHRWMVSLTEHCDWTVGLCDKEFAKGSTGGHAYGLCCQGNKLGVFLTDFDEDTTSAPPESQRPLGERGCVFSEPVEFLGKDGVLEMPRPTKVEVFWDFASSTLSFFNRSSQFQKTEIFTIEMDDTWDLFPFVNLGKKSPHSQTSRDFWGAVQENRQQRWQCTCGNSFGGNFMGQTNMKFPQDICSCGGLVGRPYITEILCELL